MINFQMAVLTPAQATGGRGTTDATRKQYKLDPGLTGALVTSVARDCETRDLGIVAGDVIAATQGEPVATLDDARRAITAAHKQHHAYLAVLVQRTQRVGFCSRSAALRS